MKFCVLAKISKRMVTFWYQSENNPYAPLRMRESNEVPLYFYVNGNDFIFGSAARDTFHRHDPNAYGNYFEIVKEPGLHFTIHGIRKPIKQLLYYGVEQYLSHFLNTVLFKSESIESYRQHFPLRFMFETDVEDHEKSLIEHLFKEAGYFNLERVSYDKSLFAIMSQKGVLPISKAILMLNASDDVLYATLYGSSGATEAIGSFRLAGHGADPRVRILADMIVEYIILQNSYLSIDKDNEVAVLLPFSASLLENFRPIITGEAELSDGTKHWFKINAQNLDGRLQYYSNDSLIYSAIDDLLISAGIGIDAVTILLGSEQIGTSYFSSKLLKKYPAVIAIKPADIGDCLKAVFAGVNSVDRKVRPEPMDTMVLKTSLAAPPLPVQKPKLPPPLPPKKIIVNPAAAVNIPKLPPLPPKKSQ